MGTRCGGDELIVFGLMVFFYPSGWVCGWERRDAACGLCSISFSVLCCMHGLFGYSVQGGR
jgi:hypothetical protein